MNLVILNGRFTKDPELRETGSGKKYCRFTLAVQREFSRDEADFINCVAWDKRAESIAQYFKKGKKIGVQGRISVRTYESNGEKKWSTDVIVDKFEFLESQSINGQSNYSENTEPQYIPASSNDDSMDDDDDFPF